MSSYQPEQGEHVVDRAGQVWLAVMDGGMLTRASAAGPISIGVQTAHDTLGPLRRVDPNATDELPPTPWGEAEPTTTALAGFLRDLSRRQFETWLERASTQRDEGLACFMQRHEGRLADLELALEQANHRLGQAQDRVAELTTAHAEAERLREEAVAALREADQVFADLRRENLDLIARSSRPLRDHETADLLDELRRRVQ